MKLYHYIAKGNNALQQGILSLANNPQADLHYYYDRTGGATTHATVVRWMDGCFSGRSRAVRGFTEPIRWTARSIKCLKNFVDNADCFAIDLTALNRDGLIEAVYVSPAVLSVPNVQDGPGVDELWQKIGSIAEIDYTPIDWSICDDELGRRFAYVRYYLIVVKGGVIPPQYICQEYPYETESPA